jgi:Cdc6-like AAA superfamily ATPase
MVEKYNTKNPFAITKAVDFTDQEILDYWVDIKEENSGFCQIIEPTVPKNKIILGSKGSGKTHILRYFSYNVQKLQSNKQHLFKKIQQDGYLGIYLRCTGLNSNRFSNKGVSDEQWHSLFFLLF